MTADLQTPRLYACLAEWMASGHQLGAQVHVWRGGETLADFAIGEARPGVPMRTDTHLLWLSASKPLAAVALAQLREQQKLDFDDPVARHVPEFAAEGKGEITLKQILTHTAGLRFIEVGWPEASWNQIIDTLCAAKPEPGWPIGEKAGYSPFASWFILAEVVQRLDGRSFDTYCREAILRPAGATESGFVLDPAAYAALGDRIGWLMNTTKQPPVPSGFDTPQAAAACRPSGGGRGPARDLSRFYQGMLASLADGSTRGEPAAFLSRESAELLIARHRVGTFDHTFRHVMDWGLGFIPNNRRHGAAPYGYGATASDRAFGHGGAQSTCAFADPERKLVVVCIFNGMCGEPAHQRRLRATLDALEADLAAISG